MAQRSSDADDSDRGQTGLPEPVQKLRMCWEAAGYHALRSESLAAEFVTRHFRDRLPGPVTAADSPVGRLVPTRDAAILAIHCAEYASPPELPAGHRERRIRCTLRGYDLDAIVSVVQGFGRVALKGGLPDVMALFEPTVGAEAGSSLGRAARLAEALCARDVIGQAAWM